MAFTFTSLSPTRRTLVALLAALMVVVLAYETRMLDSGYTAWLEMVRSEDETPGAGLASRVQRHGVLQRPHDRRRGQRAPRHRRRRSRSCCPWAASSRWRPATRITTASTRSWIPARRCRAGILDLYIWSCHEALEFGRRRIEVTVLRLGWDPRASSPSLIDRLFRRRELARRAEESRTDEARRRGRGGTVLRRQPSEGSDGFGPETQPPGASTPPDAATPFAGVDPSVATPAPAAAVPPAP